MNSPLVNILLSTYNGEKYLPQQLDSILAQKDVRVKIQVRDDGSSDNTLSILTHYAKVSTLSVCSDGHNLGPARSFMTLLAQSASDADYYAFADQDDYWQPDKISTAVTMLHDYNDVPALYFSQTQLADQNLQPLPSVIINPKLTYGESLVYEFVGGCTMVLNKKLRDIAGTYHPHYIPMHDVWIYSIALAIGAKVIFDPQPHILYRQHASNTIGQGSQLREWKRRCQRIISKEHSRYRRACELHKGFSHLMPQANRQQTNLFLQAKTSPIQRLRLLLSPNYRCANLRTWILFKIAVLTNQY